MRFFHLSSRADGYKRLQNRLHELELAKIVSDKILCLKGEYVEGYGTPEEIFSGDFIKRLFEQEVPEIFEGIVEIKSISREPGQRSKMAVISSDPNVDPLGACIGPQRSRISKICDELCGEKIDIVIYNDDPCEFIKQALKPADVISVDIPDEEVKSCTVVVPDNQLSLAIGNKGQNAKLAAKLTGYKIDIKPESGFFEG